VQLSTSQGHTELDGGSSSPAGTGAMEAETTMEEERRLRKRKRATDAVLFEPIF